jgi:hypothetical protein
MIMEKKCAECKVTKPISEFHKRVDNIDGLNKKCRMCVNEYQRERTKNKTKKPEDVSARFALNKPGVEEYQVMYKFLISAGYDITKDIHKQFCEKYNLVPKPRNVKDRNQYTYQQCFKTGE